MPTIYRFQQAIKILLECTCLPSLLLRPIEKPQYTIDNRYCTTQLITQNFHDSSYSEMKKNLELKTILFYTRCEISAGN